MVRLTAAALALLAVGCTGLIDDGGGEGLTPEQAEAKKAWIDKAFPVLSTNCLTCHNGSRANTGFLEGSSPMEVRDDLIAFEPLVVNMTAPQSSRLLTKGIHEGPALTAEQASFVLEWLQKEKEAQPEPDENGPILETAQFLPLICTSGLPGEPTCPINDVALDELGIAGAKIRFVAQALGSGLYVNNLKLIPGPMGAFIEHPLFVSWRPCPEEGAPDCNPLFGEPAPDTIDRFFSVKMNLMAGLPDTDPLTQIGGGTAAFVGFVATDKLTIHFKSALPFQMDDPMDPGGETGGCKDLASFKANAQGPMNQSCGTGNGNCHTGGNANAVSAMGLNGVQTTDDAMIQLACNQARIRMNLQNFDQSGVYLAPDPANNNHPFRFPSADALLAFKTALNVWATAERDAP